MTIQSLYRLMAGATMLGAVLFVLGFVFGGPPPKVAPLANTLILTGALLLLLGLTALYLRQREESGILGLIGAALTLISIFLLTGLNYILAFLVPALAASAPEVLSTFPGEEWATVMAVNLAGRIGLALGLLLFAIASYQSAVLPRWAAILAALGGLGALVQLTVVLLNLPQPLGMVVILLPVGLFGLGRGLWLSVSSPVVPVVGPQGAVKAPYAS
jgi:hypothetical protein